MASRKLVEALSSPSDNAIRPGPVDLTDPILLNSNSPAGRNSGRGFLILVPKSAFRIVVPRSLDMIAGTI